MDPKRVCGREILEGLIQGAPRDSSRPPKHCNSPLRAKCSPLPKFSFAPSRTYVNLTLSLPLKETLLTSLFSILFTCTCLSGDLSLLLHFAWHASSNTTIPLPELVQYMGVQTCRLLSCHWLHLRSKYTFQPTGALEISINRGCIFVSDRQTDRPILNPICMG